MSNDLYIQYKSLTSFKPWQQLYTDYPPTRVKPLFYYEMLISVAPEYWQLYNGGLVTGKISSPVATCFGVYICIAKLNTDDKKNIT
jgi:hypothetical protein